MRDSFIFYRSFQKAIDACSQDDQLLIYKAIANYALDRVEPDLSGVAQVCWVLIKPQLDANWKRYDNGCKGGEFGKKGGAPKGNKNANKGKTTPKQPQENPIAVEITTPNNNVNHNLNNNDNSNGNVLNKRETKRFSKPTIEEIETYISENSYSISSKAFYDYYEANGWMVGRNKMKDWRAAIRSWNSKEWNKGNCANDGKTTGVRNNTPRQLDFEKRETDPNRKICKSTF